MAIRVALEPNLNEICLGNEIVVADHFERDIIGGSAVVREIDGEAIFRDFDACADLAIGGVEAYALGAEVLTGIRPNRNSVWLRSEGHLVFHSRHGWREHPHPENGYSPHKARIRGCGGTLQSEDSRSPQAFFTAESQCQFAAALAGAAMAFRASVFHELNHLDETMIMWALVFSFNIMKSGVRCWRAAMARTARAITSKAG